MKIRTCLEGRERDTVNSFPLLKHHLPGDNVTKPFLQLSLPAHSKTWMWPKLENPLMFLFLSLGELMMGNRKHWTEQRPIGRKSRATALLPFGNNVWIFRSQISQSYPPFFFKIKYIWIFNMIFSSSNLICNIAMYSTNDLHKCDLQYFLYLQPTFFQPGIQGRVHGFLRFYCVRKVYGLLLGLATIAIQKAEWLGEGNAAVGRPQP